MEQANETSGGDSVSTRNMARGGQTSGGASARQVINDLSSSVWAFSALACALETGLLEALSDPSNNPFILGCGSTQRRNGAEPRRLEFCK